MEKSRFYFKQPMINGKIVVKAIGSVAFPNKCQFIVI